MHQLQPFRWDAKQPVFSGHMHCGVITKPTQVTCNIESAITELRTLMKARICLISLEAIATQVSQAVHDNAQCSPRACIVDHNCLKLGHQGKTLENTGKHGPEHSAAHVKTAIMITVVRLTNGAWWWEQDEIGRTGSGLLGTHLRSYCTPDGKCIQYDRVVTTQQTLKPVAARAAYQ